MKRDYLVYVGDIIEAILKVQQYSAGNTYNTFVRNEVLVDGVVRNLEIIGEAAKHVPEPIRRRYPGVPWSEMVGMRNKLVHEYFGVDTRVLWRTVSEDLPAVLPALRDLLEDLPKDST